ncbi:hypothetical protein Tco_0256735 [Tanacetum coccineum]
MGPYIFKISGQIYHWIGSLCPEDDDHLRFLQMYIYDTDNEVNNRMHHFGGLDAPGLNPEIVEGLIHVLDEHNELVRLFRTARDRCNAGEIPGFKIRLYNLGGVRGYELPTSDVLGAIVFKDGPRSRTDFDVIIEFRGGPPKRISKLHQSYMSLQFSLLFVFGQPRFYPEFILKPRNGRGDGRKSRLNFLRSDYLSGLYDAISKGDHWGIMTGSIILLPSTFTGGPRILTPVDRADIVDSKNKITDASQIDEYNSAELPDPVKDPRGYKVVSELMLHGPCGAANLSAPCTQNGTCNKNFPKRFNANTFSDSNGHTQYRRIDTETHFMKHESRLDNCNVVLYNRVLCLAFEAHINVEYCEWSMLIKYLFKYISKGPDRIHANIIRSIGEPLTSASANNKKIDEIQNYVDGHSKQWKRRKIATKKSLRRLTYVHPSSGELFYFRMLLCHQKGCKSPTEVRTVKGEIFPTYRAACEALGLLGDDKE